MDTKVLLSPVPYVETEMKDEDLAYMSALARLSGRIETMKKFDDEVSTERLKEKFNQDLERAGVESETFKVE